MENESTAKTAKQDPRSLDHSPGAKTALMFDCLASIVTNKRYSRIDTTADSAKKAPEFSDWTNN